MVNGGQQYAILDAVTAFGLSLPKAWRGAESRIPDWAGDGRTQRVALFQEIESLRVEPGALVLEVED